MPRPPTFRHPLRDIRAASPHATQAAFARLIGVSAPAIQAIENGKLRMTQKLAARIHAATGASEAELLKGGSGKAKTADGKPYTRESFQHWQESQRRAQVAAAKSQAAGPREDSPAPHLETWLRLLLEAASSRAGAPAPSRTAQTIIAECLATAGQKLDLADAVNERLIPYQTVRTRSADTASLRAKAATEPAAAEISQAAALLQAKLGKRTRLTLSLQVSPCWAPHRPPPASQASNLELFPAGYGIAGLGRAGCRAAAAFCRQLAAEHGIDPRTGHPVRKSPTGNWQAFFRAARAGRFSSRVLLADLDPDTLSHLSGKESGILASDSWLPADFERSGGILPGAAQGAAFAGRISDRLDALASDCGGASGLFVFLALEGTAGGVMAAQALRTIRGAFPSMPIAAVAILPPPGGGDRPGAPYHTALAIEALAACASIVLLVDNADILTRARKSWRVGSPTLADGNALLGEMLCALTTPLRVASPEAPPLSLRQFLAEFDRPPSLAGTITDSEAASAPTSGAAATFAEIDCVPLRSLAASGAETAPAPRLLAKAAKVFELGRKDAFAGLFLRGIAAPPDVISPPRAAKIRPTVLRLTQNRNPGCHESLTWLHPAGASLDRLKELATQAGALLERRALLHWYAGAGISESALAGAVQQLAAVARSR